MPFFSRIARIQDRRRVKAIADCERALNDATDEELRRRSSALRYRARTGEAPAKLLADSFALTREASRRTVGQRHFDVQLLGGMCLCRRGFAEMQTGEGKTLTATLPLSLFAQYGRGAHLATVNDYLARRDAEFTRPIYAALGLTVGVIESTSSPEERRRAYECDITYGTAKEFGFDFLRDRLALRKEQLFGRGVLDRMSSDEERSVAASTVQRAPYFVLVDEADSVLIDDAGTPLIIAGTAGKASAVDAVRYRWAAAAREKLVEDEHFDYVHSERRIELTDLGRRFVRSLEQPPELVPLGWGVIYEDIERAVLVHRLYRRERQYVVRKGEVEIVDEFTGRVAVGRKWQAGVHQAVEAQEDLEITDDGGQAARITVQELFRRYPHLAGMTGTIAGTVGEMKRIYRLDAVAIPTNRPPIRAAWPTRVFGAAEARWQAVVEEITEVHATGRPVLIGTRSIDKSERLSKLLLEVGIRHDVLNARHEAQEADIVKRAGEQRRVTVATNMAGRGTDIKLGAGVLELGGLHVIVTEMHDAARIDRQLIGRCGRQGDPGTYRLFLALDDELLLQGFGVAKAELWRSFGISATKPLESYAARFRRAQKNIEKRAFTQRRRLMEYESHRRRAAIPLGLDPYLDLPG
jgi:preprotein translocase subunit SecA